MRLLVLELNSRLLCTCSVISQVVHSYDKRACALSSGQVAQQISQEHLLLLAGYGRLKHLNLVVKILVSCTRKVALWGRGLESTRYSSSS